MFVDGMQGLKEKMGKSFRVFPRYVCCCFIYFKFG